MSAYAAEVNRTVGRARRSADHAGRRCADAAGARDRDVAAAADRRAAESRRGPETRRPRTASCSRTTSRASWRGRIRRRSRALRRRRRRAPIGSAWGRWTRWCAAAAAEAPFFPPLIRRAHCAASRSRPEADAVQHLRELRREHGRPRDEGARRPGTRSAASPGAGQHSAARCVHAPREKRPAAGRIGTCDARSATESIT